MGYYLIDFILYICIVKSIEKYDYLFFDKMVRDILTY